MIGGGNHGETPTQSDPLVVDPVGLLQGLPRIVEWTNLLLGGGYFITSSRDPSHSWAEILYPDQSVRGRPPSSYENMPIGKPWGFWVGV